jgi:hypothetical protein
MSEVEPTVAEPVVEPVAATTETPSLLNDEGNFNDGWKSNLPEEIRENSAFTNVKNIGDMGNQLINAQKAIGKDKVALPGDNASPEEWAEFHSQTGRPATPADYVIDIADEAKEIVAPELLESFREVAHKAGLTQKQIETVIGFEIENSLKGIEAMNGDTEREKAKAGEALREKWGADYESRLHITNRVIAENAEGEDKAYILSKIGNDPIIGNFLANIGSRFQEARIMTGEKSGIPSPSEARSKANELRTTDYLTGEMKRNNPELHDRTTREIQELTQIANKG